MSRYGSKTRTNWQGTSLHKNIFKEDEIIIADREMRKGILLGILKKLNTKGPPHLEKKIGLCQDMEVKLELTGRVPLYIRTFLKKMK